MQDLDITLTRRNPLHGAFKFKIWRDTPSPEGDSAKCGKIIIPFPQIQLLHGCKSCGFNQLTARATLLVRCVSAACSSPLLKDEIQIHDAFYSFNNAWRRPWKCDVCDRECDTVESILASNPASLNLNVETWEKALELIAWWVNKLPFISHVSSRLHDQYSRITKQFRFYPFEHQG